MAFTTVTGSNGVTSLVGTTGVDIATIVTLESNTFVGGNTGDDNINLNLGTAGQNASGYNVRMGGGDDQFTAGNTILDSFVSLDGETLANDGNDTYTGGGNLIINSEIVGRGGNDVFTGMALNGSTLNGNTGTDRITVGASSSSFVYGGQGVDVITTTGAGTGMMINGNKGSDQITLGAAAYTGSVHGGNGNDTISANATVVAAATDAGVYISGDLGVDNITGSGGVDTINGGEGVDTIAAGAGADIIDGGAGNDDITGGAGADTLTGGAGNDEFNIANADSRLTATSLSSGFDTITDFAANTAAIAGAVVANGDTLDLVNFGAGAAFGLAGASTQASGGVSLNADLLAAEAAGQLDIAVATDASAVTITGAVAWAGDYIIQAAGVNYVLGDTVIKVNTFTGTTTNTFV